MAKIPSQTFRTGELTVYPAHGVAMVTGVEKKKISGADEAFYVLKVLGTDATIMVPIGNVGNVGLRKVMKKSMVPKVYSILKERKRASASADTQTWNRRYRDYTEKMKTGCAMEVARVLRDLYSLKNGKELSFGERRMLDTARNLLVKEISVAEKKKEENVEKKLDSIFKRA